MVTQNFLTFDLKPLDTESIKRENVVTRYNELTDTLIIHFFGPERRATLLEMENDVSIRIDMQTHEIVGLQLERFMSVLVPKIRQWLAVAELLGIDDARINEARAKVTPEHAQQVVFDSILEEFKIDLLLAAS
jgi:uncharacterized protein YuzE